MAGSFCRVNCVHVVDIGRFFQQNEKCCGSFESRKKFRFQFQKSDFLPLAVFWRWISTEVFQKIFHNAQEILHDFSAHFLLAKKRKFDSGQISALDILLSYPQGRTE